MDKETAKPNFSGEALFEVDFKKRQEEMRNEILRLLGSKEFQDSTHEEVLKILRDHDVLTNLGKRLFENGAYQGQFKTLFSSELDLFFKERLWKRAAFLIPLLITNVISALTPLLIAWFFKKKI